MTVVRSTLETAAGVPVTARLVGPSTWTTHHSEIYSPVSTTTDSVGAWSLDLAPQSSIRDAGSYWVIEHPQRRRAVVVPDSGPVYVDTIEISVPGYPLPGAPSVYLTRDELGQPEGPASLGLDGKVPAAQLPAGSGGDPADATTTSKGVVQLSGDLSGTATAPTVPGLAAKYVKPGSGIPSSDLSAAVQVSLGKADASAADADLDALALDTVTALGTKADAAATTTALAGKATKPRIVQAYIADMGRVTYQNTGGAWQPLATWPTLSIAAAVGDYIDFTFSGLKKPEIARVDVAVLAAGVPVRYLSSGSGVPAFDGDVGWQLPGGGFFGRPGASGFTVQSGDLSAGNVVFGVVVNDGGTSTLDGSANYPFFWRANNLGPVS